MSGIAFPYQYMTDLEMASSAEPWNLTDLSPLERPLFLPEHTGVLYLGGHAAAQEALWRMRRPVRFAINYLLNGGLRHRDEAGVSTWLKAGDAFQRVPHLAHETSPEPGYQECFVSVDAQTMNYLAKLGFLDLSGNLLIGIPPERVMPDFLELYHRVNDESTSTQELILQAARWFSRFTTQEAPMDRLVIEAEKLMLRHLESRQSLHEIAKALGITYDHFRLRFRRATGQSPGDWLIDQRIEKAKALLQIHSVGETAEALGYPEPFSFSRQFKKRTGISPRRFQQELHDPQTTPPH